MKAMAAGVALAALLGATLAQAAGPATVEAVQYPAWIERGGRTAPLSPGIALRASDTLRTGKNARLVLRLGEGSTVKLGERARFVIERVEPRGVFRAALRVLAGALRFTTAALGKHRRRDIEIRVRNVTAGIRGTDVWGKSTEARDLVCLLEGRVEVGSEGHAPVTLDTPRAFYQKPRDGEPRVSRVDEKQVAIWSAETEIAADGPAARVGGRWRVVASRFTLRAPALALNRRLRAEGYPSRVRTEGRLQIVEIGGLAGETEARALMANLRTVRGVTIPSIRGPGAPG